MGSKGKNIPKYRTPFRPALEGVWQTIRRERNFRFHLFAAFCAVLLGFFFSLSKAEWIAVLFSIFGVFSMELMNTAVERTVDLADGRYHPLAKQAKDAAAAAVLMAAVLAAIIGCIVFLPKLLHLFEGAAF
ncbi:undecaprenol kinase [Weizmannia acidilactici]|uniref:Undecaprenol kinase n=1 Tax=Weizmannia acidilactici TaxID=2607726 RepID=A0A5J4JGV5_9BACI|nr:diacylglycerol kinase family protein [Weizmannia acidilactici]GER66935.1 undecaprenol kinase [Weizmannia acidilactici]GER69588.1 undecaprenol kinase [Weizmannia acidilactici]GER72735.1 undecaprenol kinase [Weizmannia acidilactici]